MGSSIRQDPLQGRTAHTKCGMYLFPSSLAAALLDDLFEQPACAWGQWRSQSAGAVRAQGSLSPSAQPTLCNFIKLVSPG